ncbi:hypothetical protein SOP85_05890 [Pseudomonas sp. YuFO20]|uniref:hypothetical protein n=1 Tax=Pseudomonas sp. YuFO20 TaxID=3095362 RepID=UPI002B2508F9|nr:hypothetical protein [Pseudomonas sp. YuFO20]MEB2514967.1 hypothetical protein [Pseudomonas sp. YuFO20]
MDVKVVDPAFFSPLDPSQREAYFFILTEIWRQIADELVVRNPAARYVEIRDKVDAELDAVFKRYDGRLHDFLEERAAEAINRIPFP